MAPRVSTCTCQHASPATARPAGRRDRTDAGDARAERLRQLLRRAREGAKPGTRAEGAADRRRLMATVSDVDKSMKDRASVAGDHVGSELCSDKRETPTFRLLALACLSSNIYVEIHYLLSFILRFTESQVPQNLQSNS
jgi:hypothetical protein